MKVIHICQRDDPDTGGSLRVAEALVREQRAAGLDAGILFLYGSPGHVAAAFGEGIVCLGLKSSKQAWSGVPALARALSRLKPDIVHLHDGIVWPRLTLMHLRFPVVMHSHLPVRDSDSRVGRYLIRKTTKMLLGISLHTIETWVKDGYRPSKVHYVPNGVDFRRFGILGADEKRALRAKLSLPPDKRILLWVGRVHRSMKGSDRVERVANLLPDDMVLVMVGNGPEFQGIVERNQPLIKSGKLVMAGSISKPEQYYKAADDFLFTSYHEPFGLVILEAVASGLPIFAFPVTKGGGAVLLLKEFGAVMLDDAESDPVIASIIAGTKNRAEDRQKNLNRAHSKYSWKSVAESVNEVYELALNKTI